MSHKGLVEKVGDWLDSQTKDLRLIFLIVTFMFVVFVHGFLLRRVFVYGDVFMLYYLEFIISLLFGGPICWFVVALMVYFMD